MYDIKKTQKTVLQALELSLGVITTACENCKISRGTFYKWYQEDEEFKDAVDEIKEVVLDFAESSLHQQIKDENTAATIFYLKTKGKHRGYVEQVNYKDLTPPEHEQLSDEELRERIKRLASDV